MGVDAEQDGTQIQRGAALIRRDVVPVRLDAEGAGVQEQFHRRSGHVQVAGAAVHALGVLVRAEHPHPAIDTAIGLESLEAGRSVVEDPGEAVERKVEVVGRDRLAPSAVDAFGIHDGLGGIVIEGSFGIIDFCHDMWLVVSSFQSSTRWSLLYVWILVSLARIM